MILFFNHYSVLIVSVGLAVTAGLILLTNKPKWNDYLAFGVIVSGLITAWIVIHPRQTPLMNDAKMVQQAIGAGTPILLEFQSPYCIACTQIKPTVDELENELQNQISIGMPMRIIRLDIQENVGKELASTYHVQFTPTFIFFDTTGNEMWRTVGEFDPQKVRDSLQ